MRPSMSSISLPKAAFIHTGPASYLDHLCPLADLLSLPILVSEEKTFDAAKKYYPKVHVEYISLLDLSLEFLATNFDLIFESGHTWATELIPLFELLFKTKMRIIYCPHGNSDKGYSQTTSLRKDISLIYGPHMRDLLKNQSANEILVETGNYRLPYFRKHQKFYESLIQETVTLDPQKQTLLYAPTWADGENPTSFFDSCQRLIEDVSGRFNLIIKLHPFLLEFHPGETLQIISQYEHLAHFLSDFPPIYPLLNLADAYLGDFSSIAYDFLAFDKPLYFFKTAPHPIHQCGWTIPKEASIAEFIEKTIGDEKFRGERKKLYAYAFGEGNPEILEGIKEALSVDRASWN